MPKQNHIHKLKKHKYKSGNTVFFCILPDCTFKMDSALMLGKRAVCNLCGNEFIMNEYTVKLMLPHCIDCNKVKITDSEGRKIYVRKNSTLRTSNVSNSSADDLTQRLASISASTTEEDL